MTDGVTMLLDFIYETETGKSRPACYEVIYGHNQRKLPKPLTTFTLDEVIKSGASWTRRFKSSAAGAAQFMRATLRDLKASMDLDGDEKFDADLQDRMAYQLLVRRGYHDFISGKITVETFGKNLAKEWASFPVLANTRGQQRQVKRGESFYAGDALNKSLVKPETVEEVLWAVKKLGKNKLTIADPGELSKSPRKSKTVWMWASSAIMSAVSGVGAFLGDLDWRVQIVFSVAIIAFAIYGIRRRNDLYKEVKGLFNADDDS